MSKYLLKTMGCKSNQFESNILEEKLLQSGFKQTKELKEADYYILNSCSVTQKSDSEALYLLRNAKNINPKIKTVLTGCVAQLNNKELKNIPYIDFVFGNDDKFNITEYILNNKKYAVSDIMQLDKFNYQKLSDTSKTRINLKIQDGCDNRCSYCTIPFARGKSRSADENFIINEIEKYAQHGFKEVVFTGIHIGQWGIEKNKKLIDLLKSVENTSILRYRLGSLNPTEIPPEVLDFLKSSAKFCPHFHLSLQSACDKTLNSMNRFYRTEDYLKQIEYISDNFNKPFIGADIIAGFAGETEKDFEETVNNLKKSKLTKIHTFPYSIRKGTKAEKSEGHLPEHVKNERADIIKRISAEKFKMFLENNIGEIKSVLIEKNRDKHTGLLRGLSENYINVLVDDAQNLFNTIQQVKIEKIENNITYGRIIKTK